MSDNSNAYHAAVPADPRAAGAEVQKYLVERVEVIQQPLVQMAAGGPVKEDMFASFTSAFGAAKRAMGHTDTMIVVSDLTRRDPKVRNFRNVVVNGVLTRFHSKAWRDRMMEHGYSGVMEFGDVFKSMRSTEAALGDTISPELWKRTAEVTLEEWQRIAGCQPAQDARTRRDPARHQPARHVERRRRSSSRSRTRSTNSTATSNSRPTRNSWRARRAISPAGQSARNLAISLVCFQPSCS